MIRDSKQNFKLTWELLTLVFIKLSAFLRHALVKPVKPSFTSFRYIRICITLHRNRRSCPSVYVLYDFELKVLLPFLDLSLV